MIAEPAVDANEEEKDEPELDTLAPDFKRFDFDALDEIAHVQRDSSPEWSRNSANPLYFSYVAVPDLVEEPHDNRADGMDDFEGIYDRLRAVGRGDGDGDFI